MGGHRDDDLVTTIEEARESEMKVKAKVKAKEVSGFDGECR